MFTNNVQAVDTDGTMASDSWRVVVKASQDRLEIKKSVDKNTAKRGEKVKYTVSVKNISGTKLKDVKVKDSLDGVTLTKTSGNITVTTNGNQANIGIFNPDETVTFEYEYTVPATAAGGSKIENIATATDPKGKEYTARQEVTVEGEPELTVKKTVDKPIVEAGDIVTYTLSVKNSGSTDLANVDINDVMPGVDPANFIDFNLDPSSTVGQAVGNVSIKSDAVDRKSVV